VEVLQLGFLNQGTNMTTHPESEIVKVATGNLVEVEFWREALAAAQIPAQVLGADLSAGLGSALPGSVELWVPKEHQSQAIAAIQLAQSQTSAEPSVAHEHPVSDAIPETPPHHLKKMFPKT
jgi:hypothetical protein